MPLLPTTSSEYLADADLPGAKSWSCALRISGVDGSFTSCVVDSGSDPAMRSVPVQGPADAVAQRDCGRVPDLRSRAVDIESAALGEEVDAPPVERRLEAERCTQRLADGAGDPDRPDGQMPRRRFDPGYLRNQRHQRVQRRHLAAGQDVG